MANFIFRRSTINKFILALIAFAVAGCAVEKGIVPGALYGKLPETANDQVVVNGSENPKGTLTVTIPPAPPPPAKLSTVIPSPKESTKTEVADITLSFDQIPLPSFIQVAFGTILKKNYSVDPQVAARTDMVTLRTGSAQTPSQVLTTVTMLLKTYGIAVTELGGFYRIAPDKDQGAYSPEIRRGRAQPEVPLPLRPIYNLVEMASVKNNDVGNILTTMFGTKINIVPDPIRNALLISGQPTDVAAALEAIRVLDQPMMRGRNSRRIVPTSLSADELSKKLVEVLSAEGYSISTTLNLATPIILIPVPTSNSLLAFAVEPAILDHVVAWAKQLDMTDNSDRRSGGYFTYPVKYADAQDLAKTMQDILSSSATATATPAVGAVPANTARGPNKIVVNTATNTLIFVSSQDQYMQLLGILKELDQPSKSALIEVTVAEVDITDQNSLGVQWALNGGNASGSSSTSSTIGQTVAGASAILGGTTGGLTVNYLSGSGKVSATLSALASLAKVTVLSTPRVMARNGETATISVGDQVPIITSQISNANTQATGTTGANAGILQTIQYLPTGVILKVKPIIHSGSRVELDVSQEVSSASATTTGVSTSPTISTRKVDTKLSIRDGATVLLGGLMSSTDTKGDSGIPYLKDIPGLGQLFRTNTDSLVKKELVVLITPYIIDDDRVAEQVTDAFRNQLGPWAQTAPGNSPMPKIVSPQPDNPAPVKIESPQTEVTAPAPPKEIAAPAENADAPMVVPAATQSFLQPVGDPALLEELRKAAASHGTPAKTVPNQKQ